jgi:tetratricopeptide (TPR) repeat protein
MRTITLYRLLLATLAAAAMAGCAAEHQKFVEPAARDFDRQRLDIMYQVAEQQYKVGDLAKCRESLKTALAVKTPYAPMHVLAARVELEGGNLDVAASQLKDALAIDGTKAETLYLLGVVYQRWQKYDTACDYYQQACEKNVGEALYVLAVAEMRITLGQLGQAKQFLEDKSLYFEQSASMRIALARIATLQGDAAAAARYYRDATMLLPDDKSLRWTYAEALFDAGKYSDAARILEDLRRDPPALPKARNSLARDAAADADTDQAAAASVKISLLMTLGESYVALKRPLDARDCFQEVIRASPDNVSAYLALGKTCLLTDDLATTAAAAQKALRFEPENVPAMILQAAVLQKQQKWTESLDMLNKAARVSPKDLTVLCMKGISQMQLGQQDAAINSFQMAVAISPADAWANELLGRLKPIAAPAMPALPVTPDDGALGLNPVRANTPVVTGPAPAPAVTNAMPDSKIGP